MKLPKKLQRFSEPTLLVIGDKITSHFWLAKRQSVNEIETLTLPRERTTDAEAGFPTPGLGWTTGTEKDTDEERLNRYTRSIAERIEAYLKKGIMQHFDLVMPALLVRKVCSYLSEDAASRVEHILKRDLTKVPLPNVLERVLAA